MNDLKMFFKPEFLNRVDEIVIFNPLSKALLKQIVDIQVKRMKKYLQEKRIDILLTDAAKERLGESGFDPVYGARPLKRAIQRDTESAGHEAPGRDISGGRCYPGRR